MKHKATLLRAAGTLRFATAGTKGNGPSLDVPAEFRTGLLKLFPTCESVTAADAFTYRLLDGSGKELGKLHLEDAARFPRADGYGGSIEVGVVTGADGRIAGALPGKNRETPAYLARLSRMKFFCRWNGLKLAEAAEKKVDTVTRATYSSRAVIAGVRNAARTALAPKPAVQSNPAAMRLPQFDGQLKKLFPDYAELLPCGGPDCRILAADGTELGMLLLENGDTERTTAFADTIELALALRADGTVAGILIGANQETPAYLDFVREAPFFSSWNGLTPKQALFREVDAVTGATYSSRAIRAGVRRIAERYLTREVNQ